MNTILKTINIGRLFDVIQHHASMFIISGFGVRALVGIVSLLLGVFYTYAYIKPDVQWSVIYECQEQLMPLIGYAIIFLFLGIFTLYTADPKLRLSKFGRNISVFGMAFYLMYALTFVVSGAYSALAPYMTISYAYFCEAFTDT